MNSKIFALTLVLFVSGFLLILAAGNALALEDSDYSIEYLDPQEDNGSGAMDDASVSNVDIIKVSSSKSSTSLIFVIEVRGVIDTGSAGNYNFNYAINMDIDGDKSTDWSVYATGKNGEFLVQLYQEGAETEIPITDYSGAGTSKLTMTVSLEQITDEISSFNIFGRTYAGDGSYESSDACPNTWFEPLTYGLVGTVTYNGVPSAAEVSLYFDNEGTWDWRESFYTDSNGDYFYSSYPINSGTYALEADGEGFDTSYMFSEKKYTFTADGSNTVYYDMVITDESTSDDDVADDDVVADDDIVADDDDFGSITLGPFQYSGGEPITKATVTIDSGLDSASGTTNSDGYVTFDNYDEEWFYEYTLTVEKDNTDLLTIDNVEIYNGEVDYNGASTPPRSLVSASSYEEPSVAEESACCATAILVAIPIAILLFMVILPSVILKRKS